jgi:hypothetical protein
MNKERNSRMTSRRKAIGAKRAFRVIVLIGVLIAPVSSGAQDDKKDPCTSYQQCDNLGTKALQSGKADAAIELFELQAKYAEIADVQQGHVDAGPGKTPSYTLGILAYNNLAVANSRKRDFLQARLWCRVVLRWDKDNKAAHFNLVQIENKLTGFKWPHSTTGTYLSYAGWGQWNELIVREKAAGKISVYFSGMWMGLNPDYGPSGLGEFRADIALKDHRATYIAKSDNTCKVWMEFSPDKIDSKQEGDCEFGHNVTATGTFERASTTAKIPPPDEQ